MTNETEKLNDWIGKMPAWDKEEEWPTFLLKAGELNISTAQTRADEVNRRALAALKSINAEKDETRTKIETDLQSLVRLRITKYCHFSGQS